MSAPRKIVRSFFYTIGSGYAARLCSLVITFLLKDELGPEVFDLTIKGLVFFILLSSLRDFGWLHSLLHFQDRVDEFVQTHFVLNVAFSLAGCLLTCAVGVGLYWYKPDVYAWPAIVIGAFSLFYLLRSTTQTSEALLRMEFEFGRLGLFHGLATVLALASALAAAWYGWGRWSLVLGGWSTFSVFSGVYTLVYASAVWFSRPIRLWPLQLDWIWARRLLNYGKWFWLAWGVLLNFIWYYDKLVLAFIGDERYETSLALYDHAWWLMQLPTAIIAHIVFAYTNTLYSRYQRDRARLSELFSTMMAIIFRGSAFVALLLLANAYEVTALLKPEWAAAAPMMVWLAGYAFLRPLFDDGIGLLWAVGDTRRTAGIMGVQALVALVLVPTALLWRGVEGLAYSMGIVAAIGVIGVFAALRRYVDIAWKRVFAAPLAALVLATLASAAYGQIAAFSFWIDLVVRSGLLLIVYGAALWLLERRMIVAKWEQLRRTLREGEEA
jgi:O-antigen/teichoic acid export membrane protein